MKKKHWVADEITIKSGISFFLSMSVEWQLDESQQLKLLDLESYEDLEVLKEKLHRGKSLALDKRTLTVISLMLGIRKAIEVLYPKKNWNTYMYTNNKVFNNRTPLSVILDDGLDGLWSVRNYLHSCLGSHGY